MLPCPFPREIAAVTAFGKRRLANSNRTAVGHRRLPPAPGSRTSSTCVSRGLLKRLGVSSKTPPTRALSLGLNSRDVFFASRDGLPGNTRPGTRLTGNRYRKPIACERAAFSAAHPHRGRTSPTGDVRSATDCPNPGPARSGARPLGTLFRLFVPTQGLPGRRSIVSRPHSKEATHTHRLTSGFWRDAWTWMLYSNSKSFPAG
jgi:hypothetical protein